LVQVVPDTKGQDGSSQPRKEGGAGRGNAQQDPQSEAKVNVGALFFPRIGFVEKGWVN